MGLLPRIDAPLHPILVHFTVALSVSSLAFDAIATIFGFETAASAGWWTLVACTIATAGTVASGLISRYRLAMEEGKARRFLRAHMALGPVAFGALIGVTAWRAMFAADRSFTSLGYLAAMTGVVVIVTVQGYLGGELVYRFGAEVRGSYPRLPTEPEPAQSDTAQQARQAPMEGR